MTFCQEIEKHLSCAWKSVPSPADVRFTKQHATSNLATTQMAINITMLSAHNVLAYMLILLNPICYVGWNHIPFDTNILREFNFVDIFWHFVVMKYWLISLDINFAIFRKFCWIGFTKFSSQFSLNKLHTIDIISGVLFVDHRDVLTKWH